MSFKKNDPIHSLVNSYKMVSTGMGWPGSWLSACDICVTVGGALDFSQHTQVIQCIYVDCVSLVSLRYNLENCIPWAIPN